MLEGQCSELHCELAGWQDRLRAAVAEAEVRGRSQATSALSRLATLHSTAAQGTYVYMYVYANRYMYKYDYTYRTVGL